MCHNSCKLYIRIEKQTHIVCYYTIQYTILDKKLNGCGELLI